MWNFFRLILIFVRKHLTAYQLQKLHQKRTSVFMYNVRKEWFAFVSLSLMYYDQLWTRKNIKFN